MSWMKTITRNASKPNPIRVPRPYETTPSIPDMLPSSPLDFRRNSGQDAQDNRFGIVGRAVLNLGFSPRAHRDHGAGKFERHAGKRMVGVEHDLVLRHVGDREDQVRVLAIRSALEAHSDLEDLGKAAARLDSEKIFVVVAESILGLETHFDPVPDFLAFEGGLDRGKYVPVAAVQILQRLIGTLDRFAPDVGQLDVERDDRVFCDAQALGRARGPTPFNAAI